jgi:hypothetical protein
MFVTIASSGGPPSPTPTGFLAERRLTASFQNAPDHWTIIGTIHHDNMDMIGHHRSTHDAPAPCARGLNQRYRGI